MIMKTVSRNISGAFVAVAISFCAGGVSADETTASGSFRGASNHVTTGGVSVVKTGNGGTKVVLGADFSLDNAPDPYVGFGRHGRYDKKASLGVLGSKSGKQVYTVPRNVDVSKYNEVYIWCRKFGVPLGVAVIK
jgi:hypothetical protein